MMRTTSPLVAYEEHPAIDQADSVEAQLARSIAIVKLDHIRVQEHLRSRSEVDPMLLAGGLFVGAVPFEVHGGPDLREY